MGSKTIVITAQVPEDTDIFDVSEILEGIDIFSVENEEAIVWESIPAFLAEWSEERVF